MYEDEVVSHSISIYSCDLDVPPAMLWQDPQSEKMVVPNDRSVAELMSSRYSQSGDDPQRPQRH